jgi:hypothetical protein
VYWKNALKWHVPQGLKPYPFFGGFYGPAKAVPFYKACLPPSFFIASEAVLFQNAAQPNSLGTKD